MYSPETVSRLETLRQIAQQRDLTLDEQREVINLLREGRSKAAEAVGKARASRAKPSGEQVLANLFATLGTGGKS